LLGRFGEAALDFTEAIRIQPNNRDAYLNRAFSFRHLADLPENLPQRNYYLQLAREDDDAASRLDN